MLGQSYAKVMMMLMMSKTNRNWIFSVEEKSYLYFSSVTVLKMPYIDPSSPMIMFVCLFVCYNNLLTEFWFIRRKNRSIISGDFKC